MFHPDRRWPGGCPEHQFGCNATTERRQGHTDSENRHKSRGDANGTAS
eukprot:CAMPEP_0183548976 /NCGR_PEP_ID=MMETSP0371-20130417/61991_1 /TAXON_ID=268820 /ORGANISM="Peridinium aciculiferum, Strain PAER-2" /LENGTH=47 /DNA_ID= /DNA_START= /DNA_END= /DNA_ORIENTATION=